MTDLLKLEPEHEEVWQLALQAVETSRGATMAIRCQRAPCLLARVGPTAWGPLFASASWEVSTSTGPHVVGGVGAGCDQPGPHHRSTASRAMLTPRERAAGAFSAALAQGRSRVLGADGMGGDHRDAAGERPKCCAADHRGSRNPAPLHRRTGRRPPRTDAAASRANSWKPSRTTAAAGRTCN